MQAPVALAALAAVWMLIALVVAGFIIPTLFGLVATVALLTAVWIVALIQMLQNHWLPDWRDNG
jgi:hypothetical protein